MSVRVHWLARTVTNGLRPLTHGEIGYVGRILLHNNVWDNTGFDMQICCLIIAPVSLSAPSLPPPSITFVTGIPCCCHLSDSYAHRQHTRHSIFSYNAQILPLDLYLVRFSLLSPTSRRRCYGCHCGWKQDTIN